MARARKDVKLETEEQPTDVIGFLKFLEELRLRIPDEELAEIPCDASVNLDYYLYGNPKQQP